MATNTGIRKCKNKKCNKEFTKKYAMQCYCSYDCANSVKTKYNKPVESKPVAESKAAPIKRNSRKINQVSSTNKCFCSDGTVLTSVEINRRIRKAKQQKIDSMMDEHGHVFCEDCKDFGLPKGAIPMELKIIDCSHNISVDEAKKSRKSELAYEVNNIRMRCRVHHRKHDETE